MTNSHRWLRKVRMSLEGLMIAAKPILLLKPLALMLVGGDLRAERSPQSGKASKRVCYHRPPALGRAIHPQQCYRR